LKNGGSVFEYLGLFQYVLLGYKRPVFPHTIKMAVIIDRTGVTGFYAENRCCFCLMIWVKKIGGAHGWMGSGQYYRWDKKSITSESLPLDIRELNSKRLLTQGASITSKWSSGGEVCASISGLVFEDYLQLQYTYRKTEEIKQKIYFEWTPCNYGGRRVWFSCPFCHRRIAVIYGAGKYFACRKCYNLAYLSCNEPDYQRMIDRANNLKEKLGGEGGLYSPIPSRPKGMHDKTYQKMVEEIARLEWIGEMTIDKLLNGF
jgi:hypothetical protein